jgi:hypothetical protein
MALLWLRRHIHLMIASLDEPFILLSRPVFLIAQHQRPNGEPLPFCL